MVNLSGSCGHDIVTKYPQPVTFAQGLVRKKKCLSYKQWRKREGDRPPCLFPLPVKRSLGVHLVHVRGYSVRMYRYGFVDTRSGGRYRLSCIWLEG